MYLASVQFRFTVNAVCPNLSGPGFILLSRQEKYSGFIKLSFIFSFRGFFPLCLDGFSLRVLIGLEIIAMTQIYYTTTWQIGFKIFPFDNEANPNETNPNQPPRSGWFCTDKRTAKQQEEYSKLSWKRSKKKSMKQVCVK